MSSASHGDASGAFAPAGPGTGSPYAVKLPVFEGPLDLLLHLIRLNEVEITDIPIARIGEQYLEYIELMRDLNLDVAGEYLLMAATLAWIKSRMLLPPDGLEDEDEGLDPRAELVARLLEYQRFREAAGQLGGRRLLGRDVFDARVQALESPPASEREIEVGLFELIEAYRRALAAAPAGGAAHEVEVELVTVRERMEVVMRVLEQRKTIEFEQVFVESGEPRPSRLLIVATFLAVLELTRLAALRLYQGLGATGVPEGPIRLRRTGDPGDTGWTQRIAHL
jgi:segregation and condensation protein A